MTRIPDAIDKLVEIWASVDARVIDGPVVTGGEPVKRLYVGYDGDPEGEHAGASGDQSWAGTVGAHRRDETFTVPCCVVVHKGSGTVKAARDAAFAIVDSASTILRANVSLGFPSPSNAQLADISLGYGLSENTGLEVRVPFNVHVSTRI